MLLKDSTLVLKDQLLKEKAQIFLLVNEIHLYFIILPWMKFCKYLNISPECNFNPTLLYILYELSTKFLLGYNLILIINLINRRLFIFFSWLPTTWRSTFYGMLQENFIITWSNLGNRRSYMVPNTSSIMEVSKEEKKLKENYKQNIKV